ncbi:hypothetical protein NXT3_PB00093 (plasmid) [Sinorhizobium fredii]|uniref:Uncharacterized protein n=1 Tax=Rhizobium fredii TaxID=380 RepID=A0A2L0HBB0_RHIFR|nr:hypothetical protein NXT3_PB00093 [Sinorhizobium fredii]
MHSPDYTEETATVNTGQVRSGEDNISLRWLDAAMKPPTQLPETDPAKLPWHDAANDSLPTLTDGLPVELRTRNARSNRLSNLPNAFSSWEARSIQRTSLPGTTILPRSDMFGGYRTRRSSDGGPAPSECEQSKEQLHGADADLEMCCCRDRRGF